MDVYSRFWSKVDISAGINGCWPWVAGAYPDGYGKFGVEGKATHAPRWLLGHLRGRHLVWSHDEKEVACHRCDNPPCCNPTHLYIGTPRDNARDRVLRGRGRSGVINACKTECPRGHPYLGSNMFLKNGSRNCRECNRLKAREYRARLQGGESDR